MVPGYKILDIKNYFSSCNIVTFNRIHLLKYFCYGITNRCKTSWYRDIHYRHACLHIYLRIEIKINRYRNQIVYIYIRCIVIYLYLQYVSLVLLADLRQIETTDCLTDG